MKKLSLAASLNTSLIYYIYIHPVNLEMERIRCLLLAALLIILSLFIVIAMIIIECTAAFSSEMTSYHTDSLIHVKQIIKIFAV